MLSAHCDSDQLVMPCLHLLSEGIFNSWAEKLLDARNKLVHSKYNNGDDLVLSRNELEDVLVRHETPPAGPNPCNA